MDTINISPLSPFSTTIRVPGDKSISHRAAILLSIARGQGKVKNFLQSEDCLSTLAALKSLGVQIKEFGQKQIIIQGTGGKFTKPSKTLKLNNSGTGFRLLCGVLAAQGFLSKLTGDDSLVKRPMKRIVTPLALMGAQLKGKGVKELPPLNIRGGNLQGITYLSPIASAQVKSTVLLASLFAKGTTIFSEPAQSRDHTERMLTYLGADLKTKGLTTQIKGKQTLTAKDISIPGDISSAAFFIALGLMKKNTKLTIENVGLNPTRTGIIDVLKKMGAKIEIKERKSPAYFEPSGSLTVKSSSLKGIKIEESLIPNIIDEIPIIALLASQASGITVVKDARELRVKESDRIQTIVSNFKKMGIKIEEKEDGFIIRGKNQIKKAVVDSCGDHRMAMTLIVAGLLSKEGLTINKVKCIETSFPGFLNIVTKIK